MKQLVVIILISVAAALGYAIYRQRNDSVVPVAQTSRSPDASSPSTSPIEEDVDFLLNIKATALEADKKRHFLLAAQMARESENVRITNCVANPVVLKVKNDAPIKMTNEDSVEHTISFTPSLRIVIPPKSTKEFPATLGNGPALYGYGCDQNTSGSGIIFVVP